MEISMVNSNYIHYYYIENYLFLNVSDKFNRNHRIDAFDFICILKWQCEEFDVDELKKIIFERSREIKEIPKRFNSNFDFLIKRITRELYSISDNEEKAKYLFVDWEFPPETIINLLSILYQNDFLFYSEKAANILDGGKAKKFRNFSGLKNFNSFWKRYQEYIQKINKSVPNDITLNDKVRWLAGKHIQSQTKFNIN